MPVPNARTITPFIAEDLAGGESIVGGDALNTEPYVLGDRVPAAVVEADNGPGHVAFGTDNGDGTWEMPATFQVGNLVYVIT